MYNQDLIYRIALPSVEGIGSIRAKHLLRIFGNATAIFKEKEHLAALVPDLPERVIKEIQRPEILHRAEREAAFLERHKIIPLFITDNAYPQRLNAYADSPVMLYLKGNVDLNAERIISVVGTRNATPYGKMMTEKLTWEIADKHPETLIVSGLAYGIDVCAHKAALKNSLPTVGVLAHGMDRIYPAVHRDVAVEMLSRGGLLTDFVSETTPERQNFVKRNRIVAGISDCTIVVESAERGGALITMRMADGYGKKVFAVPGRVTDVYSAGCNASIQSRCAISIGCAEDLFREMNWNESFERKQAIPHILFPDLTPEEQAVRKVLAEKEDIQLDTLCIELDMLAHQLFPLLLAMEMKGLLSHLPGGRYQALN
jgi:DNA processing protein